jgi:hypothetical protein
MATENLANFTAATTLAAAITTTNGTSLTVTSSATFPAAPFRVVIDTELMLVTVVSGTTWTVTRGVESTTAATHASGTAVYAVLTAAGIFEAMPFTIVNGTITFTNTNINTNGTNALISTYKGANSDGNNIIIGGGGQSSVGAVGETYKGASNTAVGINALLNNTTGNFNAVNGRDALRSNTAGNNNTASGSNALYSNTTGNFNAANGSNALYSNTTGNNNTASGRDALRFNTTGSSNTASGLGALYSNTTGSNNTANGRDALYDLNITANNGSGNNTALGYNTGRGIVTGVNNTILGANVTGLASTLSNNIIIADGAGNRRINVDASGNVGIIITSPTAKLHLPAGAATASTAPLKFDSTTPVLLTTAEIGAIEYDATRFYATPTATLRERIMTGWNAGATLAASTTTTITDARAKTTSTIFIQSTSAAAAALGIYVSTKSNGSFVITHASAVGTETVDYVIIN